MKLPSELFSVVVEYSPLISIDLVVRSSAGDVLLGERLNRPAQGYWFVPGGRILKDESMLQAFERLCEEELGVSLGINDARFLGPYEHFYTDNFSGEDFSTHYVVLGYEVTLDAPIAQLPKLQHGRYRWWPEEKLLEAEDVHLHTKWYFNKELKQKAGIGC